VLWLSISPSVASLLQLFAAEVSGIASLAVVTAIWFAWRIRAQRHEEALVFQRETEFFNSVQSDIDLLLRVEA
jgi:hypothetical protein